MMFCVSVTVKGLYSNDSFRKEIEYATATITANKRKLCRQVMMSIVNSCLST